MKILIGTTLFLLVACAENSKSRKLDNSELSIMDKTQIIVDSFKLECNRASSSQQLDSVSNKYNKKIFDYLSDKFLDSIRVHVDTVIVDGWTVTTRFHYNNDIVFRYGLTFKSKMDSHFDSLFQFMKGLPIGRDTTVSFTYMAAHTLIIPQPNVSSPTLLLSAIPLPIFMRNH